MLAADSLTAKKTQIQHTTSLLDQLCHLSAALQEVREQRHELFEQQQTLHKQEARMLEEYSSVLTQLASLRERGFSQNF
jgi:chromosome segregation ATPase